MSDAFLGLAIIVVVATTLFVAARLVLFKLLEIKLFENDRLVEQTPDDVGLPYQELLIRIGSRRLQAWLVSAPDSTKPSPVILILHGQGETVYATKVGGSWFTEVVDTGDGFTSLALDASGNPRISYWDASHGSLQFAYSEDGGATWPSGNIENS